MEEKPASLDLAFDWVKNVLIEQSHVADALDKKATTLFSVATVILGIGVSAGILSLHGTHVSLQSLIFAGLTISSYGFVIGFAISAMRLLRFENLDNPIEIRKWFWDLEPTQFKIQLLTHLEDSYSKNEDKLNHKSNATRWLMVSTAAKVMFMVVTLAFTI